MDGWRSMSAKRKWIFRNTLPSEFIYSIQSHYNNVDLTDKIAPPTSNWLSIISTSDEDNNAASNSLANGMTVKIHSFSNFRHVDRHEWIQFFITCYHILFQTEINFKNLLFERTYIVSRGCRRYPLLFLYELCAALKAVCYRFTALFKHIDVHRRRRRLYVN